MCAFSTTLLKTRDVKDVGYDELVALRDRCSVKLQQICLRTWYFSIKHASWSIGNQREKLLDMPRHQKCQLTLRNFIRQYCYIVNTTYMPCTDLLGHCSCSCNKYACWLSVTVTNIPAVQTYLLVECCCKMDACWAVATQSACLLTFCHSILHVCWRCASLSAIPAGMVSHYQPTCWYGVSLSAVPACVVLHYRSCLLVWYLTSVMPVGVVPHYRPCLLVWCLAVCYVFWCYASL